jgi:hypothetical protein
MNVLQYDINEIIDSLPDTFTSHEFIQVFTQAYQRAYIEALYEYRDSEEPFQKVHAQIAQSLHKVKRIKFLGKEGFDKNI